MSLTDAKMLSLADQLEEDERLAKQSAKEKEEEKIKSSKKPAHNKSK